MGQIRARTRVTTTHVVPSYGGFQFEKEHLIEIANGIASGLIPMNLQHDSSRPLHPENIEAGVEKLEDGHWVVWADFDIDEDAWAEYEAALQAAGAPGGMSVSVTSLIPGMPAEAAIWVIGDAHHFSQAELQSAARLLSERSGRASSAKHLYQFSTIPEARVVFEMLYSTVMALGPNIVASYIYDALKGLGRAGKKTIIEPYFRRESDGSVEAGFRVETADPAITMMAMNEMARLLENGVKGTFMFDGGSSYVEIAKPPRELDEDD
jgi:hypothetical protein